MGAPFAAAHTFRQTGPFRPAHAGPRARERRLRRLRHPTRRGRADGAAVRSAGRRADHRSRPGVQVPRLAVTRRSTHTETSLLRTTPGPGAGNLTRRAVLRRAPVVPVPDGRTAASARPLPDARAGRCDRARGRRRRGRRAAAARPVHRRAAGRLAALERAARPRGRLRRARPARGRMAVPRPPGRHRRRAEPAVAADHASPPGPRRCAWRRRCSAGTSTATARRAGWCTSAPARTSGVRARSRRTRSRRRAGHVGAHAGAVRAAVPAAGRLGGRPGLGRDRADRARHAAARARRGGAAGPVPARGWPSTAACRRTGRCGWAC